MKKYILFFMIVLASLGLHAQDKQKLSRKERRALEKEKITEKIKTLVEAQTFVFTPNQAIPVSMQAVNLSGIFSAQIKNDTIDCYLPFYGRAYTADYASQNGPFTFVLPIKNYNLEKTKKGYLVTFEVKNNMDNISFYFNIGTSAYTTLNLSSTNRQSMSYYGVIDDLQE